MVATHLLDHHRRNPRLDEQVDQVGAPHLATELSVLPSFARLADKWGESNNLTPIGTIIDAGLVQNSGSVRTRTVASSVYNMSVQASSLIASNVYRQGKYPKGSSWIPH